MEEHPEDKDSEESLKENKTEEKISPAPRERIEAVINNIKKWEYFGETMNEEEIKQFEIITRFVVEHSYALAARPIMEALISLEELINAPDTLQDYKKHRMRDIVGAEYRLLGNALKQAGKKR